MQKEEQHILQKFIEGDESAFNDFFETYYTDLCNFVNAYIRNESVSEDIVQDVFVYIWKNRKNLAITSSLKHYLFTSAKNKSLNYLRNLRTRLSKEQQAIVDYEESSEQTDKEISLKELQHLLNHAIENLPPKCREIYLLSRDEELSNKDISEKLGISIKTVENQMTIALRKIREALQCYHHEMVCLFLLWIINK